MLCFLVDFCCAFLFLYPKRVSRGTQRSWGKRVVGGSRARQRPRSATRWCPAGSLPVLPSRFRLRGKSPEHLWDNQTSAAANQAAWAFWGVSEGSLGANSPFAYGTVWCAYVNYLYLSPWLALTGGLVMWQDLLPTPQKPTVTMLTLGRIRKKCACMHAVLLPLCRRSSRKVCFRKQVGEVIVFYAMVVSSL